MLSVNLSSLLEGQEPICDADCSLREAFEAIREGGKGYVVLFKNGFPAGILTERDLLRFLSEGISFEEKAIDHAVKDLITVKEYRDIYYALSLMVENNVRRLIVVDEENRFKGTATLEKLLYRLEEDFLKRKLRVRDLLMGKELYHVKPETPMGEVIKLMRSKNVGALPVLKEGFPVGIITERDLVKFFDRMDLAKPVSLYMSSPVVVVSLDQTVEEAIRLMEERNIRRLVVVDDDGKVVGIISNRDIARNAYEGYGRFLEVKLKHAKDVLNLLPEPTLEVLDLGKDQVIVWLNEKAKSLFGNLVDSSITEVIPEREWGYIYSKLLKERKVERFRFSVEHTVYELSASYLPTETSDIRGRIKVLLRDITEESKAQRVIARGLENYQRIMNSTEDMIIVYRAEDGLIRLVNNATMKRLGYTEEELKRLTIFHIVQADPEFIMQNIQRILRRDEVIRGRRFYKTAYSESVPVEIVATKVFLNHEPYILIVARDISEKLKLEEEIEKKTTELESLHDFIINLNRANSEGEAYSMLAHMLVKTVGVDTLTVYRVNPSLNRVVDAIIYGSLEYLPCLEEGNEPTACKVFLSSQPFVVKDTKAYSCPLFRSGYGSYMCMSVVSGGRTIAILNMVSSKEGFFYKERKEFIEQIVHTFAPFLSNLKLIEINRELSIRDPLTNLYNRRFIVEFLQKELERAKRNRTNLSILLMDLDHFKKINDTYGHQVGDMCLKVFAEVLMGNVRSMDMVCRWGGEEFIVVLPTTERLQAVEVANRVRRALKERVIYTKELKPVSITVSVGVAVFPEDGEDMDTLIKVADDKLYMAKKEGRDRIVP